MVYNSVMEFETGVPVANTTPRLSVISLIYRHLSSISEDFWASVAESPANVRVIFVTKDVDFKALHATAKKIEDVTKTMNTILEGMPEDLDCASCSFKPVCDEVEGLKELHFGKAGKKEHHA